MASANRESSPQGVPWYKRLFARPSRGARPEPSVAKPAASPAPAMIHFCDLCDFSAKVRGTVYDHIKSVHKDVLDRNGHIGDRIVPAA